MAFYENFKSICESKELSLGSVCIACGLSESAHSKWKTSAPKSDVAIKLSEYLNVSIDYLLLGKEPTLPSEYKSLIHSYKQLSNDNKQLLKEILSSMINIQETNEETSKTKFVTIRHSIYKASAGIGYDLDEDDNWEDIEVPETSESLKADFAVTIDGDSMEPKFHDGDIVLIKSQPSVDIGDICIYIIENEGYVKKYGGDRLISLNDKYDDILFSDYDADSIYCCGLVIGQV